MSMRKNQPFTYYKFITYSMYHRPLASTLRCQMKSQADESYSAAKGRNYMFEAPFNWNSFWDLTTPAEAAATLRDTYGPAAAEAAAQCATAASDDNRESDHRFWLAVSEELSKSDGTAPAAP